MFSQPCVKNFVYRVGVLFPRQTPPGRHPLGRHPPGQTPPPRVDTPLGRHTPLRRPLQWTVRILLECILVYTRKCI